MHLLLTLIIPFIFFFTAPIVQIRLCNSRISNQTWLSIGAATFIMFITGIVLCIAAICMMLYGINYNTGPSERIRCVTGPVGFGIFMVMINMSVIPLIGLIKYAAYRKQAGNELLPTSYATPASRA